MKSKLSEICTKNRFVSKIFAKLLEAVFFSHCNALLMIIKFSLNLYL